MKHLQRLLIALAILLTLAVGGFLVQVVISMPEVIEEVEKKTTRPVTTKTEEPETLKTSVAEYLLNRLRLSPLQGGKLPLIAVMVENSEHARPHQIGFDRAVMIQEWFVEGLISRYALLMRADDLPPYVGPVRSLRPYFIDGTAPWTDLYFHAGGSPQALGYFESSDDITSINGLFGVYEDVYKRDPAISPPHNLFLDRAKATDIVADNGIEKISWPPYAIGATGSSEDATSVSINFYNPLHNTTYTFKPWLQTYERTSGKVTYDVEPNNVLILETPVEEIVEEGRLVISVAGDGGKLLLFRNGKVIEGMWHKRNLKDPFEFLDTEGKPLRFSKGLTWLTAVPIMSRISWE